MERINNEPYYMKSVGHYLSAGEKVLHDALNKKKGA